MAWGLKAKGVTLLRPEKEENSVHSLACMQKFSMAGVESEGEGKRDEAGRENQKPCCQEPWLDLIDHEYNEDTMVWCDISSLNSLMTWAGHGQNHVLGRSLWISVELWRMGWIGEKGKEIQKQRRLHGYILNSQHRHSINTNMGWGGVGPKGNPCLLAL